MNSRKALLLVAMEPSASLEEEFNDWYDTEHFPQRSALPGFQSASRWVCISGWPRWLAVYDLASAAALESDSYRAVSGSNSTPWSRRLLPRTVGRMRVVAEQKLPGDALILEPARTSRLLVARYPATVAQHEDAVGNELISNFRALEGVLQVRLFQSARASVADYWVIAEFDYPISAETATNAVGRVGRTGADILNLYVPYYRAAR
jgi:hypothetical protein